MLVEEMLAYIFSGAPTSAEFLSWTISKLAEFPSLQSKLLKEIENAVGREKGKVNLSEYFPPHMEIFLIH